jgi:hypothetical protein
MAGNRGSPDQSGTGIAQYPRHLFERRTGSKYIVDDQN